MLTSGMSALCQGDPPFPSMLLMSKSRALEAGPKRKSSDKVNGRGYVLATCAACWVPVLCLEIFSTAICRNPCSSESLGGAVALVSVIQLRM